MRFFQNPEKISAMSAAREKNAEHFFAERENRVTSIDNFFPRRYNGDRMDNLILIGMPSSGKSTAGVLLAKRIGYGFIDCDLIIQGEEKALLSELIAERGAEGFLEIEERVNAGLFATRCVIATGGSVVYCGKAMEHLKTLGRIVYLRIGEKEVEKRIPSLVKRGVVMRGEIETLSDLYRERAPLYERYAEITVDCDGRTVEETVEAIIAAVGL